MERKRLIWADSLKGLLIILVVLGHAIQYTLGVHCGSNHLWNIVYSFHMPAFMAVSGFVAFRPSGGGKITNRLSVIYRRMRQLIVPFFIWTIVLMLVQSGISLENIKKYLIYPDNGLWFLWVLFFINVFFIFGDYISERIKSKQDYVIAAICMALAAVMVLFEIRVFGFQFFAYYFMFYSFGFFVHKYYDKVVTNNTSITIGLTFVWIVLAWFWKMHELPSWLHFLPMQGLMQYGYRFITAAIAIYVLFAVSPLILNKDNTWNRPIMKLGSLSLGIYTTHFILIGSVVVFCRGLFENDSVVVVSSFLLALLLSWVIVWLLSKWSVSSKYFLGKI